MPAVMQSWTFSLPMQQQTCLISAVRAPDALAKSDPHKRVWRMLRRCILKSALAKGDVLCGGGVPACFQQDGGGSFMGPVEQPYASLAEYLRDVDRVPHHAHLHLVHAAEIVGYKHPDPAIREFWIDFYRHAVEDMHLAIELEVEMDKRLAH